MTRHTYSQLVKLDFKRGVLCPDRAGDLRRDNKSTSVRGPQIIHLLLILPSTATRSSWPRLDKVYVVLPKLTRVLVDTHILESKVKGLLDGKTGLASCICS
jgi:hypothetical protein